MRTLMLLAGLALLSGCATGSNNGKILIDGDSISDLYTPYVQQDMPCVSHAPGYASKFGPNDRDSQYTIDHMQEILAGGPYKIIYFNAGVHDIWEGVPISDYVAHLTSIAESFQGTGAAVVFATTTPYPSRFITMNARIDAYNAAAVQAMKAHGVGIDDLNSWAQGQDGLHLQGNYHWTVAGSQYLAGGVERSLNLYGGCG